MNFEIGKELFEIAETKKDARCSFKKYARERPGDAVGYNLYQALSVEKSKMPRVIEMMDDLNILNLIFDYQEVAN